MKKRLNRPDGDPKRAEHVGALQQIRALAGDAGLRRYTDWAAELVPYDGFPLYGMPELFMASEL